MSVDCVATEDIVFGVSESATLAAIAIGGLIIVGFARRR